MPDFSPRAILITGASSGIGAALARYYAAPGVTLFLTGRDKTRLDEIVESCRARGAAAEGFCVDVTQRAVMESLVVRLDESNPLDLVIANAGISGGGGLESGEQVRRIFAVNVDGVFNTILPVLPRMVARGAGRIGVVASLAGFTGWPGAPAYAASKAAMRVYAEALHGAVRRSGVRVCAICPGFVESRMTAGNAYPMPFFMTAPRAAARIAAGLAAGRARIAFPWGAYLVAGAIGLLPAWASVRILENTPRKAALPDRKV